MDLCPERAEPGVVCHITAVSSRALPGKESPMSAHGIYPITQPNTYICIDDDLSKTPASLPTPRAARFLAIVGLAIGISLAALMLLGTWLSLSTQPTDRATTFVVHSEAQTPSADESEPIAVSPFSLDDILTQF